MKRTMMTAAAMIAVLGCAAMALAQAAPGGGAGAPGGGRAGGAIGGGTGGARGGRGPAVPAGPPQPVPAAVAIPRPTTQEVTQINADLKRLVESDMSPDKTLLTKFESLIQITQPRQNPAIMPAPFNMQRHNGFVDLAKKGDIDLLFAGDSITDWWQTNGQEAYKKYFGDSKTADFAIAGDTTQGVLWRLQNGEGQGFQPKAIMLMIGTNNAGANTAPEIAEGVGADIYELRKDFPNAKILLLAIFPRSDPGDPIREKLSDVNKIIAKLDDHEHVFFMDIGAKFLGPDGAFLPNTFLADKLHPQEKGYEIWGDAVKPTLDSYLK